MTPTPKNGFVRDALWKALLVTISLLISGNTWLAVENWRLNQRLVETHSRDQLSNAGQHESMWRSIERNAATSERFEEINRRLSTIEKKIDRLGD